MSIWNQKSTLISAVQNWQERGLLDATTAQALQSDITTNIKPRSFTSIIMLLGVICLAFGIMTFVGANWEDMSSRARVLLLMASLWASWGLSIWFKSRGREWAAQVFVMLACAIFGASIMLIGQIYQLQGEPKDAVWLWAMGTGIAALATRSIPALVLYVMLITLWVFVDFKIFGKSYATDYSYLGYWFLGALAAWWLASRFAAHMLAIGLVVWLLYVVVNSMESQGRIENLTMLYRVLATAFVAICLVLYSYGSRKWLKEFEPAALVYLLLLVAGLVFIWYMATDYRWKGVWKLVSVSYLPGIIASLFAIAVSVLARQQLNQWRYDILVATVFTLIFLALSVSASRVPFIMEGYMLAMSIWTIRMGWRLEYRSLSTLGFLGFSGVMLLIYFETLGNLLDTSLFYLGAGILLLAGAAILPRLMRRNMQEGAKT